MIGRQLCHGIGVLFIVSIVNNASNTFSPQSVRDTQAGEGWFEDHAVAGSNADAQSTPRGFSVRLRASVTLSGWPSKA